MPQVTPELLTRLIADHQPPCVSLYIPLHAGNLDARNRSTSILQEVRHQLKSHGNTAAAEQVAEKVEAAIMRSNLWTQQYQHTAGIFVSPDFSEIVEIPRELREQISINDHFVIKPLIRVLQTAGRFEVLCVTQRKVELYQGNRDFLEKVELQGVPRNISEALGEENIKPFMTNATWTGADEPGRATGQSSRRNAYDSDIERYFRAIDKALWENHSRDAALPIVLCAVEEYHDRFRRVTKNPRILSEGINLNPDSLEVNRLREEAWRLVEPYYHQQTRWLIDRFCAAKAHHSGSDELPQVLEAASDGRVDTLLVDADAGLTFRNEDNGRSVDVLDEAAEVVLKRGGMVLVLPHELMPTDSGLAAIYRY